jgi:hypothetical protein
LLEKSGFSRRWGGIVSVNAGKNFSIHACPAGEAK